MWCVIGVLLVVLFNLFLLDRSPREAAVAHCDKHVVKMIVETTQMLMFAHHMLQDEDSDWKQRVLCEVGRPAYKFSKGHGKHPMTLWVASSPDKYRFACALGLALVDEYKLRYGKHKTHACEAPLQWLAANEPPRYDAALLDLVPAEKLAVAGLPEELLPFPLCVADDVDMEHTDPVETYRRYYLQGKRSFAKWKNVDPPYWWNVSSSPPPPLEAVVSL